MILKSETLYTGLMNVDEVIQSAPKISICESKIGDLEKEISGDESKFEIIISEQKEIENSRYVNAGHEYHFVQIAGIGFVAIRCKKRGRRCK